MANLPKKKVFDTEGNEVLPITHVSAVYDDNGTSVGTLLTNMDEKIDNKIIEGYYINGSFYNAPPITHDYVEIGGVKWATMNIGANSETDCGMYFQWGDTQGYTAAQIGNEEGLKAFSRTDYKYINDDYLTMTKYNDTDGKTVLDTSDDAAQVNWGSNWRMPTTTEFQALDAAVNTVWTQVNGIYGIQCTDKTDNSKVLFFPAGGFVFDGVRDFVDSGGGYWSSSLYDSDVTMAYILFFYNTGTNWDHSDYRNCGYSVRAIYDGSTPTVIIPILGALYIDKTTNAQYRWDGTAYVQLTKLTYTTIDDEVEEIDPTIVDEALRKTAQSLNSTEKAQVLTNLGISDLISGSLQKTAQVLSSAEKTLVLTNLGISSAKNITISTSEPTSSDGNNGDIWLVYETQ